MSTPLARAIDNTPVIHRTRANYRQVVARLEVAWNNFGSLTRQASALEAMVTYRAVKSAVALARRSGINPSHVVIF